MRCAPTHVDPRARLLSRMRKTIFGIQAASYTRGETLERRNYTHARARMWAYARAHARGPHSTASYVFIAVDEYTRDARDSPFPSFFFPLSFFSFLSFHFSLFARTLHALGRAIARIPRRDLMFIGSLTPNDIPGIY